jgi:hypothetical protein
MTRRIWAAEGTPLSATLTANQTGWTEASTVGFQIVDPAGKPAGGATYGFEGKSASSSTTAAHAGWHSLYVIGSNLPDGGSNFTLKVNYTATKTLTKEQF